MSAILNLSSIILGSIGLLIPVIALKGVKFPLSFTLYSFIACTLAIILQLYELRHRVEIGDISAVMDTINAICSVSLVLLIGTIVVNVVVLALLNKKPFSNLN